MTSAATGILVWCQSDRPEARIMLAETLLTCSAAGVPFHVHFSGCGVRIAAMLDKQIEYESESDPAAQAFLRANGYASSYDMIADTLAYATQATVCATWLRACERTADSFEHGGTPAVIAQAVADRFTILTCA